MEPETDLLIVGASTRAAAFSALRAGLRPRCADLFADADLTARCPTVRIPPGGYLALFAELAAKPSSVPWMYTGGLENRRRLVQMLALRRPLWGNDRDVLARCRNPWFVASLLREAELPCPAVRAVRDGPPAEGRWLVKPLRGAGGSGIAFAGSTAPRRAAYLQEYIEGEPHAAVFVGNGEQTRLVGVTRQLIGERWLNAGGFRYCGSLGAVQLDAAAENILTQLGRLLAVRCGLRGLFGVDLVLRDGVPWPVEINPRYTASVEVLEHAAGNLMIVNHFHVVSLECARRLILWRSGPTVPSRDGWWVGKAVLYARRSFTFPADGPWLASVTPEHPVWFLPDFADVPEAGQHTQAGQPVLTLFARALTYPACLEALRRSADALDRLLFGR